MYKIPLSLYKNPNWVTSSNNYKIFLRSRPNESKNKNDLRKKRRAKLVGKKAEGVTRWNAIELNRSFKMKKAKKTMIK